MIAALVSLAACQALVHLEKKDLPPVDADVDGAEEDVTEAPPDEGVQEEDAPDQEPDAPDMEPEADGFSCEPASSWCGGSGNVETCNEDGVSVTVTTCELGCSDLPDAHCLVMVPSNLNDASLFCMEGLEEPVLSDTAVTVTFNTDTGGITESDASHNVTTLRAEGEGLISGVYFGLHAQEEGFPALGVFSLEAFSLPASVELRFRGDRVPVLIACTDIRIEGIVDVGARMTSFGELNYYPGSGGFTSAEGPGAGVSGTNSSTGRSGGGGGGAFGGYGGNGGVTTYGGVGGSPYGNDEIVPLVGGSGGGNGTDNDPDFGMGGPGGGALQISARGSIVIEGRGTVTSGGLGGFGGDANGSGGGGGSGGGILFEAHTIIIGSGAMVAANGGGGGSSGDYNTGALGLNGEKGKADTTAADGGTSPGPDACAGGSGNDYQDLNGENVSCTVANGGGGGGGAGRIRLNAIVLDVGPASTSPQLGLPSSTTTSGPPNLE